MYKFVVCNKDDVFCHSFQMISDNGTETNNNGQNVSFHDSLAAAGSKCEHTVAVLINMGRLLFLCDVVIGDFFK